MSTRTLYLVRHGKVDFPGGIRRCIGRTELPLSEEGRRQAQELGAYFARHPVERIFTSPLGRCVETARLLSGGRYPVQTEPGLRELDMGEWENVPLCELHKELESEPRQGEGRDAGLLRFRETIDRILEGTRGDVVCTAHAGVNCCYLSMLFGTPLETSRSLPQPYGCFSRIIVSGRGNRLNKQAAEIGMLPKEAGDWGDSVIGTFNAGRARR